MRLLTLLAAWLLAAPAWAQTGPIERYVSTNVDTVLGVNGQGTASITVEGTYTGTISFLVSNGGPAVAVDCAAPSTPATDVNSTTSTGTWFCTVAGFNQFIARASSMSAGTAHIIMAAAPGGGGSGGGGGGAATAELTLQEADDASIAVGQTADAVINLNQVYDGTVWRRQTVGTAGTAAAQVVTVQGVASMTPVQIADNGGSLTVDGTVTVTDGAGALNVICDSGCSGGTTDADDASIATGQTTGLNLGLTQVYDGTVWRRMTIGTAGTASAQVLTVQGISSMVPLLATVTASNLDVQIGGSDSLTIGTFPDNEPINVAQINGVAVSMGNGASGTGVQRVTIANDSTGVIAVTDNGGSLTIDGAVTVSSGSVTVSDGAGALNVICDSGCAGGTQFAEDAASANADVGTLALARRTATPANTSGADLDYEVLQMNAGRLWVDASGTTLTVGSHAVTNAGTFAVQVDGAALTSLQLADDVVGVEDAAETAGAGLTRVGTVRRDTAASSAGADGDNATLNTNATGSLYTIDANSAAALTALQLIDNLVVVEDAVAGSGFSGVGFLAVRQDSQTALAADGDFIPPTIDSSGGLRVSIVAGAGSGGTALADDADFTDGTTSATPIGGVAEFASPTTVTEGDFGWAAITLNRALKVSLYEADGDALTPAVDVVEDAAETAGGTGPMIMSVRRDTAASSAGTTGDNATFNTDAVGRLWVTGSNLEDVASASGDQGNVIFAIRDDTLDARSGTEGDFEYLHTNAAGALWMIDVNSAAALTSSQLLDDIVGVEDAAETAGGGLAMVGSVRRDTPASSAGTTGDNATLSTNAVGALYVAPGGASVHYRTSAGSTEDEHEVKASAGILYSVLVTNTNAAARYLRCYNLNAASTTPGTSTVFWGAAIPGATTGAGFTYSFPSGMTFDTALTCALTTGAADTDVAEVAANEIKVTYTFR